MADDKRTEHVCLLVRPDIAGISGGMDEIPSTTGAEQCLVIREAFKVNQYQHICVQPRLLKNQ